MKNEAQQTTATNGQTTALFFSKIDRASKTEILRAIAKRNNITTAEAHEEVTHEEAEHLLDYLTGNARAATSALMQKHGCR